MDAKHAIRMMLATMGVAAGTGCAGVDQRLPVSPPSRHQTDSRFTVEPDAMGADAKGTGLQSESGDASPQPVERVAFTQQDSPARDSLNYVAVVDDLAVTDLAIDSDGATLQPITVAPFSTEIAPVAPGNQDTYSLQDIEAIAIANHPAIAAADATLRKSAGLRAQVGVRPNPVLGYAGQQMADRNTDQHGFFIEQEFVRGDKLQLNREVLGHTQRAQSATIITQRYRVLTDIRVRFFEAIAAQQRRDATYSFAEVAQTGVRIANDRQEAEEGTLIDTLQAQTLHSEVLLAAEQSEIAYRGAWRALAAIAGLPTDLPGRLTADLNTPGEAPDWEARYIDIITQSPELATARAIVCEKQALWRRQQVQPIPNITAQLGAGYDDGTEHGMLNAQLSAPIPVWNQNSGNISAAYSDYVRATQEVLRIERSIQSRLADAAADYDTELASVRKYEDEIIPQAKKSLELSEEAYRAGELEFLQVLIVRRSFYESTIRLISAKGKLAQAAAKVDGLLLSGGLESSPDFTAGDGLRGASFGGQ